MYYSILFIGLSKIVFIIFLLKLFFSIHLLRMEWLFTNPTNSFIIIESLKSVFLNEFIVFIFPCFMSMMIFLIFNIIPNLVNV